MGECIGVGDTLVGFCVSDFLVLYSCISWSFVFCITAVLFPYRLRCFV